MTDSGRHFDGREMLMVHDSFRREFALMPEVVSAASRRAIASAPGWLRRTSPT